MMGSSSQSPAESPGDLRGLYLEFESLFPHELALFLETGGSSARNHATLGDAFIECIQPPSSFLESPSEFHRTLFLRKVSDVTGINFRGLSPVFTRYHLHRLGAALRGLRNDSHDHHELPVSITQAQLPVVFYFLSRAPLVPNRFSLQQFHDADAFIFNSGLSPVLPTPLRELRNHSHDIQYVLPVSARPYYNQVPAESFALLPFLARTPFVPPYAYPLNSRGNGVAPQHSHVIDIDMQRDQTPSVQTRNSVVRSKFNLEKTIVGSAIQFGGSLMVANCQSSLSLSSPPLFLVNIAMLIGFAASFTGIFLRRPYPVLAGIFEKIGSLSAAWGFFVIMSRFLPAAYEWIGWLAGAVCGVAFVVSIFK